MSAMSSFIARPEISLEADTGPMPELAPAGTDGEFAPPAPGYAPLLEPWDEPLGAVEIAAPLVPSPGP